MISVTHSFRTTVIARPRTHPTSGNTSPPSMKFCPFTVTKAVELGVAGAVVVGLPADVVVVGVEVVAVVPGTLDDGRH